MSEPTLSQENCIPIQEDCMSVQQAEHDPALEKGFQISDMLETGGFSFIVAVTLFFILLSTNSVTFAQEEEIIDEPQQSSQLQEFCENIGVTPAILILDSNGRLISTSADSVADSVNPENEGAGELHSAVEQRMGECSEETDLTNLVYTEARDSRTANPIDNEEFQNEYGLGTPPPFNDVRDAFPQIVAQLKELNENGQNEVRIIMGLGTNDLIAGAPPNEVIIGIETALIDLMSLANEAEVGDVDYEVVIIIPPLMDLPNSYAAKFIFNYTNEDLQRRQINADELITLMSSNPTLFQSLQNLSEVTSVHILNPNRLTLEHLTEDRVHLTEEGQQRLAQSIAEVVISDRDYFQMINARLRARANDTQTQAVDKSPQTIALPTQQNLPSPYTTQQPSMRRTAS